MTQREAVREQTFLIYQCTDIVYSAHLIAYYHNFA